MWFESREAWLLETDFNGWDAPPEGDMWPSQMTGMGQEPPITPKHHGEGNDGQGAAVAQVSALHRSANPQRPFGAGNGTHNLLLFHTRR